VLDLNIRAARGLGAPYVCPAIGDGLAVSAIGYGVRGVRRLLNCGGADYIASPAIFSRKLSTGYPQGCGRLTTRSGEP